MISHFASNRQRELQLPPCIQPCRQSQLSKIFHLTKIIYFLKSILYLQRDVIADFLQIDPILHVRIFYFRYPNIQGSFSAGRLGWRRNISLRGPVFVSGEQKVLIYGGTIHSTIREVFNKCQTLLRKCYDLIPSLLSAFYPNSSPLTLTRPIQEILSQWKFHFSPEQIFCTYILCSHQQRGSLERN